MCKFIFILAKRKPPDCLAPGSGGSYCVGDFASGPYTNQSYYLAPGSAERRGLGHKELGQQWVKKKPQSLELLNFNLLPLRRNVSS